MLITDYLHKKGGASYLLSGIPCLFMLGMTLWAVSIKQLDFVREGAWLLAGINGLVLLLALWIACEGLFALRPARGTPRP